MLGLPEGFLYGVLGGIFAELLTLFKLRHEVTLPKWLKSWFYWFVTAGMILAGGVVVVVYLQSGIGLKAIVAVNVGASAPLILGSFAGQIPRVDIGRVD